jgi:drug/metabolite transporter (DMT)-like permease
VVFLRPRRDADRAFSHLGALLLLAVVWGGSIPVTKLGLRDIPPLTLTALRYLVAAPCFLVLLRGRPLPPPRVSWMAGALGVLGIGIGQLSQTLGVRLTSASVATVISAMIPILVVVLAAVRLHQPIRPRQAVGLGLACAGVVLVATGDPRRLPVLLRAPELGGDTLVLLSAVAVALYYVLSVELIEGSSAVTVAALSSIAGAAVLAPLSVWELGHTAVRLAPAGVFAVLYLAVLVTVAGIVVWLRALQHVPAAMAAVLQYLQPLIGVGAAAAMFGDTLGLWFWTGTALVLLGIAWSTAAWHGAPV